MPVCFQCDKVVGGVNGLHRHFRLAHKFDKFTPKFKCAEKGCFVTYSSWTLLRRHFKHFHNFDMCENATVGVSIVSSHNNEQLCDANVSNCGGAKTDNVEVEQPPDNVEVEQPPDNVEVERCQPPDNNSFKEQLKDYACKLVTKLYAKPGQPRCLVQEHVNDSTEFLSSTLSVVDEMIKVKLHNSNVDPIVTNEVSEILNILKDPFNGLTSEHYRFKYLKEKGYFIEPEEFDIDHTLVTKRVDKELKLQVDKITGIFIPLRKVLKAFLELPNVFDVICATLQSKKPDGIIGQYIHGSHWEAKKRHFEGKLVIPLNPYHDDFEVDKDLGPHSAKLGAVYVRIASLPSEFQGAVENIFITLLFNAADRCDFGNKRVFRKFIAELNFLQQTGIEILHNNANVRVFFTIGVFSADNAAMHMMLGFSEGFTANYPCRFCRVHKFTMHFQCEEDPSLLRDREQHRLDCLEANVTTTGVNGPSVLDEVEFFHSTENPSVDLMHDVFEGVCVYDLQHVLYYLIFVKKYFTTDVLNFRIIAFDYGSSISNKPVQLREKSIKDRTWKMTANEMRTFVRTLSLLVGDLVPNDDPVWGFYLILRDIVDILLCRVMQDETLVILKWKISEHHRQYTLLFDDTLKPKHHNMLHYCMTLKLSGVLSNYACDRFEANHQPSVRDARATTSRRKIAYTLAVKDQLRFAHRLLLQKGFKAVLEMGPEASHDTLDPDIVPSDFCDDISKPKYINYKGTYYGSRTCVVVAADPDGGPMFGLVESILVNAADDVCLVCKILRVVSYSSHYHAYSVDDTSDTLIKAVKISNLFDYHPVIFCMGFDGRKYVVLHHVL